MSPARIVPLVVIALLMVGGCDQQQPIAAQPSPTPGVKPGETPPVEPKQGSERERDDSAPLPPATAPTTPGVPNHPAAPATLPPPTSSPAAAPTSSLVPDGTAPPASRPFGLQPTTAVPQRGT